MKKTRIVYVLLLFAGFFDPWILPFIPVVFLIQVIAVIAQVKGNSTDENLAMGIMLDKGN